MTNLKNDKILQIIKTHSIGSFPNVKLNKLELQNLTKFVKNYYVVYLIFFENTADSYIGSSTDPGMRLRRHLSVSNTGSSPNIRAAFIENTDVSVHILGKIDPKSGREAADFAAQEMYDLELKFIAEATPSLNIYIPAEVKNKATSAGLFGSCVTLVDENNNTITQFVSQAQVLDYLPFLNIKQLKNLLASGIVADFVKGTVWNNDILVKPQHKGVLIKDILVEKARFIETNESFYKGHEVNIIDSVTSCVIFKAQSVREAANFFNKLLKDNSAQSSMLTENHISICIKKDIILDMLHARAGSLSKT